MTESNRPRRSVLYMPGSSPRALEKARGIPADGLIFDLEDAVAPAAKAEARGAVAAALGAGGYGLRERILRVNGLDTDWARDDLDAARTMDLDAILFPKIDSAEDVLAAVDAMSGARIADRVALWAMMETPSSILNAAGIAAAHPRLACLVLGTNDLAKELGARHTADRLPLLTSISICLLAARAAGLACIDGVHNAIRDEEGLRAACVQGREMGLDGKTLVHPAQVGPCNEVFAPTEAELDLARRQVAAFEEATAEGRAVAVVDGRIVENLHVAAARRTLAADRTIRAMRAMREGG